MNYKLKDTFLEDGFYVTQNYMNNPAYYAQFNLLGHEGVDFGNSNKQIIVRSPLSGTVFVSVDKNYGNLCVVEDYKQQCAVYICHMTGVKVVTGQEVKAGQQLGEMDATGNSNGEHVHLNFVILKDGSNKYRLKKYNWGFLDPQYPRDTGSTVKFEGVEDYTIQWGEGEITSDLQAQFDAQKTTLADVTRQRDELDTANKKKDGIIADLTTQLTETKNASDGFRKQYNEFVAQLANILGTRQEQVEIIASVTTCIEFEDKASQLDRTLELERKEHSVAIDSLEAKIKALESNLVTLKADFKALKDTQITSTQPTPKYSILEYILKLIGVK